MELVVIWIICGIVGAAILSGQNQAGTGCLLGLLLGPIGWIVALVMRSNANEDEARRQHQEQMTLLRAQQPLLPAPRDERECPFCAEPILARAVICKHCGRDVRAAEATSDDVRHS